MSDLLAGAAWECGSCPPGAAGDPSAADALGIDWIPATVPGTAAGALRAAGRWAWGHDDEAVLDGADWWWRTTIAAPSGGGPLLLDLGGLATIADVWVDDGHVLHSEAMFVGHQIELPDPGAGPVHLALRFAALTPALRRRRPRPRWKALLDRSQNQRWYRTSLLGRNEGWTRWAAPVGPWGPVALRATSGAPIVVFRHLRPSVDTSDGTVEIDVRLRGADLPAGAEVSVGAVRGPVDVAPDGPGIRVTGTLTVPSAQRWWPHSHGAQPRYPVTLHLGATDLDLGSVGFRSVAVDEADGGFTVEVNGVPIFCRGACWGGPDAVSLAADPSELRRSLEAVRDAGMNMVRVGGYTVYESDAFWDLCDELGILVWQDCMLAAFDPPEDDDWLDGLEAEVTQVFTRLAAHPALAVVCGSSEIHQQAAMFGLAPGSWSSTALDQRIPSVAARLLPGVPYVASSPTGGDLPFHPGAGVAHYFGVGAYLRPPSDARLAGVRFAAECLAFGTPPEQAEVDRTFGGSAPAGHDPRWKLSVSRDAGTSWDFEDVRDHYVRTLFGVDPLAERYEDPDHALDLGRAVVAELMAQVMTEWRRPTSTCAGALILTWQDLWPGAGWGVLDAGGRPKASWYALARVLAPLAVTVTDDGLAGLRIQVHNDRPAPLSATLELEVLGHGGAVAERGEQRVDVAAASAVEVGTTDLLGGFRDLNRAYRFGPSAYDVAVVTLRADDGAVLGEAIHPCGGPGRPREADVGLTATARRSADGWDLELATERFAQYVVPEISGATAGDRWFHLVPGRPRVLRLQLSEGRRPSGAVRALNSRAEAYVTIEADEEDRP